jgi:hypothetical protein
MDATSFARSRPALAVLALALLVPTSGCVGLLAQMVYWGGGAQKKAAYDGLQGKRVAVICVSDSSAFGLGTDSLYLARDVSNLLRENVEEIKLVRPDEIADWIDRHDWNEVDFAEVGRGVEADMVVAIELTSFSLYEGQTLYRGRANVKVRVLDIQAGGEEVFSRRINEITFPTNGGYAATDSSENKFRATFLQVLAEQVARHFYDHDVWDQYGVDPAGID